jgi:molybdopterin molybdotransferase
MISVDEALQLVLQNTVSLKPVKQKISDALGAVLAETIKSPIDSPPFAQSSMDGCAIRFRG